MNRALDYVFIYIYGIPVFLENKKQHLVHQQTFLQLLDKNNVIVKKDKCGFMLRPEGFLPNPLNGVIGALSFFCRFPR